MYICVDFDGTIVEHEFPDIGEPVPGAIYWMQRFIECGAKIILYTMRSDLDGRPSYLADAVDYLEAYGIDLFAVNRNPHQDSWSNSPKPYAHIYIDDAAFGCPLVEGKGRPYVDWEIVGPGVTEEIAKQQKEWGPCSGK